MVSFPKKLKLKQELFGVKMKTMKLKNIKKPVPTKKGGLGRNIHVHSGHVNGSGKGSRRK